MQRSRIPYLDFVWNPVVGCTPAGEGCRNCYAEASHTRRHTAYKSGAKLPACYSDPFGVVRCLEERLDAPLRRKKPALIGVNFLADTFHPDVPDDFIDRMFGVMSLCSKHTFVLLTKRPERMRAYLSTPGRNEKIVTGSARVLQARSSGTVFVKCRQILPMPNVWVGTTVWNQESADNNIPPLLATPAALRWVSYEPALGPVDFEHLETEGATYHTMSGSIGVDGRGQAPSPRLDWVVCGGESGPGARPMHPDWARSVRDQCKAGGVPFWFKQHGEWREASDSELPKTFHDERCKTEFACMCNKLAESADLSICTALMHSMDRLPDHWDSEGNCICNPITVRRVGTKAAGNTLDGEVIEQLPEVSHA